MAVNRAVSSHDARVGQMCAGVTVAPTPIIPLDNGYHRFRTHTDSDDVVPVQ